MHHKFVIIDDLKLITGSYNWTYNAEYRNEENVIIIENKNLINSFVDEFKRIKLNSVYQKEVIPIEVKTLLEISSEKYIKNDLVHKAIDEEKKGRFEKSVETLKIARNFIGADDSVIEERIKELEEQIRSPKFHYHIEDGQFSFNMEKSRLIGKEGEVVTVVTDRLEDLEDIYILFVEGNYVECIGNIERSFPESEEEHNELKNWMLERH